MTSEDHDLLPRFWTTGVSPVANDIPVRRICQGLTALPTFHHDGESKSNILEPQRPRFHPVFPMATPDPQREINLKENRHSSTAELHEQHPT